MREILAWTVKRRHILCGPPLFLLVGRFSLTVFIYMSSNTNEEKMYVKEDIMLPETLARHIVCRRVHVSSQN